MIKRTCVGAILVLSSMPLSAVSKDRLDTGPSARERDDWESTTQIEVKRSEIVLHPDFNALGAFKISFPEGTEVTHKDIPFPVGMITDCTEKTRNTWGVRSLPWLVLTDRGRKVVAEGITLQALDSKLSAN